MLTGEGAPARGHPGISAVLGIPTWQQEKAQRKNTGTPHALGPSPGSSVVTSEASGSGNRRAFTGRALETWGLSKHLVWAVGGSVPHRSGPIVGPHY